MTLELTYLGHSGFLAEGDGCTIAIDPFLTGNPLAVHNPRTIDCTHIVLTHGHADHLGDTFAIAKRTGAEVFAAWELCNFVESQGIQTVQPMNPGGKVATEFGFVALTPAFHSSSYEGRYMGQPCGVILRIAGVTLYHCGDTALFSDMKLIGELYKPDIAMIPIGDRFTMGPEHASRAAELIKPKVAIPIHYNTWPPIEQNPADFQPAGVEVYVMKPGDSRRFE